MFGNQPDSPCWGALFLNSPPFWGRRAGSHGCHPTGQQLPEGSCAGLGPCWQPCWLQGFMDRDFRLQNQQLVAAWQVVFLPDDLTSCPVWLNRWGDLLHKLQMAMVLASGPFVVMVTCAPFGELVGRPLHKLQLAMVLASGPFCGHGDLLVPLLE